MSDDIKDPAHWHLCRHDILRRDCTECRAPSPPPAQGASPDDTTCAHEWRPGRLTEKSGGSEEYDEEWCGKFGARLSEVESYSEEEHAAPAAQGEAPRCGYEHSVGVCTKCGWTPHSAVLRMADALAAEKSRADRAERERDLAIAHDRQPYPTAEAYETACAALRRKEDALEAAEAEVSRLTGELRRREEAMDRIGKLRPEYGADLFTAQKIAHTALLSPPRAPEKTS